MSGSGLALVDRVNNQFVVDLPFVDDASRTVSLHLVAQPSTETQPPTARIWSQGTGPYQCTSPAGRTLWFDGYDSTAPSGSLYRWSLAGSPGGVRLFCDGAA